MQPIPAMKPLHNNIHASATYVASIVVLPPVGGCVEVWGVVFGSTDRAMKNAAGIGQGANGVYSGLSPDNTKEASHMQS